MIKSIFSGIVFMLVTCTSQAMADYQKKYLDALTRVPVGEWQELLKGENGFYTKGAVSNETHILVALCAPKNILGDSRITFGIHEKKSGNYTPLGSSSKTFVYIPQTELITLRFDPEKEFDTSNGTIWLNTYPMRHLLSAMKKGNKITLNFVKDLKSYSFSLTNSANALANCREYE